MRQVLEFGPENPSLDRIQPAVIPFDFVVIFLCLAVVSQHPNPFGQYPIVRRNRSSLPASTQVFSRIEAERSRPAHGACSNPTILPRGKVFSAVSLASVFDHKQVVSIRELQDGIHVRHLAIEVYWNDRGDGTSGLLVQ